MIHPRLCLVLISGAYLSIAFPTMASETLFNPGLLEIDHPVDVDIHQFNRSNGM